MHLEREEKEEKGRVDERHQETAAGGSPEEVKARRQVEKACDQETELGQLVNGQAFSQFDNHIERAPEVGHLVLDMNGYLLES